MTKAIMSSVMLALLALSCSPSYTYLARNQQAYWNSKPCLSLEKKQLQYHAFMAILCSAYVNQWFFSRIDSAEFTIEARIGKEKDAPEMIIKAGADGLVLISRKKFEEISKDEMRFIKRRMADLEKTFNRHRCESIESLEKQMEKIEVKR